MELITGNHTVFTLTRALLAGNQLIDLVSDRLSDGDEWSREDAIHYARNIARVAAPGGRDGFGWGPNYG